MNTHDRLRRRPQLVVSLIVPAAFAALALIPVNLLDRSPSFCIYGNLFVIRCLGFGMTHTFSSLLHGELRAAWNYNRLVVAAFPFLDACAVRNLATPARILSP
jgi:hypothetical protein